MAPPEFQQQHQQVQFNSSNSLINILNYKLTKKGYSKISVGIGMDYGRALMVKAGYSGSGLNDIIWMGDVVKHLKRRISELSRYPKQITNNSKLKSFCFRTDEELKVRVRLN